MRLFMKIVLGVVVLLAIALVTTSLIVNNQTRRSIERSTSDSLGNPAQLASARVGIFTGNFTLANLNVDNAEGFQSPQFLHMDRSQGRVRLGSLFEEIVELPELTLSNIELHLEQHETTSNFGSVLQNLRQTEEKSDDDGRRYMIRELVLSDIVVHVNLAPGISDLTKFRVPIDEMRLRDVGTEADRGVLMRDVVGEVIKALIAAAIHVGDEIPQQLAEELGAHLKELDDMKSEAMELKGEVIGRIGDVLDDLEIDIDLDLDDLLPSRD